MTGAGILRHLDSRCSPLVFSDFDDLEVLFKCLRGAFDEVGSWGIAGQRNRFTVASLRYGTCFENASQPVQNKNLQGLNPVA